MGSTRPKPDYTAGLLLKGFTIDERRKLRDYASPTGRFHFTPNLCFPFLICEVVDGKTDFGKADLPNTHNGSIAVRALFQLYRAAFGEADTRVRELYGNVLVFTISHNGSRAELYGHFAVAREGSAGLLDFHRHEIAMFSLTTNHTNDRYRTYNFVRNVYDKFAPEHLKGIKGAAAH